MIGVPAYRTERDKGRSKNYAIVIPVINEGARIASLLHKMKTHKTADFGDILIVDGGSTDGSLATDLLDETSVRYLLTKTGPGKLSAQLRCAYWFVLHQGYDGVVTIDGNDKDDPDAIPDFIDALRSGVDFVQASRFIEGGIEENTPFVRRFAIRFVHAPLLSLASGFNWTDTTQGFRAYSRCILQDKRIDIFRDIFQSYELLAYLSYRVPRVGYRCLEIPTARRYPAGERTPTKISPLKGQLEIIYTLLHAIAGRYDPVGQKEQSQA